MTWSLVCAESKRVSFWTLKKEVGSIAGPCTRLLGQKVDRWKTRSRARKGCCVHTMLSCALLRRWRMYDASRRLDERAHVKGKLIILCNVVENFLMIRAN